MSVANLEPDFQIGLAELLRRVGTGCKKSAQLLYDRYRGPLLHVIRRVLSPPLRRLLDSDDFLDETMMDLFSRRFSEDVLQDPESLGRYLATIAENKVLDAHRKFLIYARRNLLKVESLHDLDPKDWPASSQAAPDEILCLQEFVEDWWVTFVDKLPLVHRAVVRRCVVGRSAAQIAKEIKLSERHVFRIIRNVETALRDSWRGNHASRSVHDSPK